MTTLPHDKSARGSRGLAFQEMRGMNAAWRSVLHLGRRCLLPRGHRVQFQGDLLFLERGQARLTHQSLEGQEKILWYIQEGCLFAETPFFDPMPAESFFICVTECVVYSFSSQSVEQISRERPDLMLNLLQSMARKLRVMSNQASSLYLDDVLVRTCKFLAQRLVPDSNPLTAVPGISRQEMASLLGVHRITLYKVLRQQEEAGLIGPFEGNSVTILRPGEFYRLVDL